MPDSTGNEEGSQKKSMRMRGGQYIKKLREATEPKMTQRDLAEQVNLKYYTFISQIENGHGRVPPELYGAFAEALGVPTNEFTQQMLKYYDPFTYQALFGTLPSEVNTGTRSSRRKDLKQA